MSAHIKNNTGQTQRSVSIILPILLIGSGQPVKRIKVILQLTLPLQHELSPNYSQCKRHALLLFHMNCPDSSRWNKAKRFRYVYVILNNDTNITNILFNVYNCIENHMLQLTAIAGLTTTYQTCHSSHKFFSSLTSPPHAPHQAR